MNGRIYRLRRKKRVGYFEPADYEAACKHIDVVKKYDALVNTVEVTTDDTTISPVLKAVLEHNGYTPKNVIIGNKKIKYSIPGTVQKRSEVLTLLQNMKNDRIKGVDFSNYSYPVGISENGVRVPLVGYTKAQAESGDRGTTTIGTSDSESSTEVSESSSPNWLLIGGIAVVGLIALLAVIKIIKK